LKKVVITRLLLKKDALRAWAAKKSDSKRFFYKPRLHIRRGLYLVFSGSFPYSLELNSVGPHHLALQANAGLDELRGIHSESACARVWGIGFADGANEKF